MCRTTLDDDSTYEHNAEVDDTHHLALRLTACVREVDERNA